MIGILKKSGTEYYLEDAETGKPIAIIPLDTPEAIVETLRDFPFSVVFIDSTFHQQETEKKETEK